MLQRFDTAQLPATPWKNGGGSTREIVCRPEGAGLDGFAWRVSIATIAQDGPFSAFPGVDRVIMLLDGDGVRLQPAGGPPHRLDQPHRPHAFAGDVAVDCTLLGGASTDFNLMTRRGVLRGELQVLHAATPLPPAPRGLLLALRGRWLCDGQWGDQPPLGAGQGLWWDGALHGGTLVPQDEGQHPGHPTGAALAWVRLNEETAA